MLRQVTIACEDMESSFPGEMPPLEDIEDDGMLVIPYAEIEGHQKNPPPMGIIKVEGTPTRAIIDTGTSVDVTDTVMLGRLTTCQR